MEILLILSGFIFACLVALLYECKIRQMRKEPRNKVRFFVTRDFLGGNTLHLWLGKPIKYEEKWTATLKSAQCIGSDLCLLSFNLNPDDFADMKVGEIREVYLDLED